MQRVVLIGDPVEHSLSPAFQQAAFDALGIDVRYEGWRTTSEQVSDRIAALRLSDYLGANVTVPHKEAVFAAVDERSALAERVGAVNTVVKRGGALIGDNTDVHGFLVPLREREFNFTEARAVVLGAGGAARGVVVALLEANIRQVTVLNRTAARAANLAADMRDARVQAARLDDALRVLTGTQLLVNATSLGWSDDLPPVATEALASLDSRAIAYDLTYRMTPFLAAAQRRGLETIDGLPMLVHQGARSFELWTGRMAPVVVMWHAAVEARRLRGG